MVNHRVPLFKPYPTGIMVKCCLLFTFIFLQMESQREESDNKSRYIMGGEKKNPSFNHYIQMQSKAW